ncbi:MAG: ABC transporter ATP-binding protein [Rhodobacteraceae bacterium]|nr:MAG: ABC transporter ATP-binding protein [Paracoccaceae bacterium]|tara:strand:- start:444 stop:1490 length:1047 start_codon:yes stop_codon:yes gene_type:complete
MGEIELNSIEKWFGDNQVLKNINLKIGDGEFIVFVGPSGCGKSTLLRVIGGLEEASRGQIFINDQDVTGYPPSKRGLSMVFQNYALYPHLNVKENMGFPLKTAGASKLEIASKVNLASKILKLEDYLERKPKTLSGGQRQRVAIGRSIVRDPTAFLFDEPLSNLDATLRVEMRLEIARLHRTLGTTMVYVTHDQVEAMTLADRIVILDSGSIIQVGRPRDIYENPANLFVAQFIGSPKMNIMPYDDRFQIILREGKVKKIQMIQKKVKYFGARPEHINVVPEGEGHFKATVEVIEYLGSDTFLIANAGEYGAITVRSLEDKKIRTGGKVGLNFNLKKIQFFDYNGIKI